MGYEKNGRTERNWQGSGLGSLEADGMARYDQHEAGKRVSVWTRSRRWWVGAL